MPSQTTMLLKTFASKGGEVNRLLRGPALSGGGPQYYILLLYR